MKPYVMVLYREYAGQEQHTSFMISSPPRHVIWFFRILLGFTAVCRGHFSRSLLYFRSVVLTLIIEFYASLKGVGILDYIPGACSPKGKREKGKDRSWSLSYRGKP